ncbi:MAG: diadenylate cyclase CdaA [Eubacteriales bacterium]|nr:diadenylate cyclase CdaA [Eubacteriales bacterium]
MNIPGIYYFQDIISKLRIPDVRWTDLVEILIIAYLAYHILLWIKNTRAWQLMRGIGVVVVMAFVAAFFNMTTILWIFQHIAGIAVTALVIILQPELRNAMEELGRKDFLSSLLRMDPAKTEEGRFSDKTINEILRACVRMGRVKTGALIVIEQTTPLLEWVRSGIELDAIVSSQLLINIFEKNTPLHDGAVIIKGNRIVSATSYLPLSSSRLDKNLGTRHRAGVGISEETDALTLIVSEETGGLSYSYKGKLWNDVTPEELRGALIRLQNKLAEGESTKNPLRSTWSGLSRHARRRTRGAVPEDAGKDQAGNGEAASVSAEETSAEEGGGAHE